MEAHPAGFSILEQDAGLHFLLKVATPLSDQALTELFLEAGIRVASLSEYYQDTANRDTHCLVINYSALDNPALDQLEARLQALHL